MFREYPISKMLKQLGRNDLLPSIVFRTSRKQCDLDLQQLSRKEYTKTGDEHQERIKAAITEIAKQNEWDLETFKKHLQYNVLVEYAAGAHHAGQLLPWRLLLEELMSAGLLRVLIATGTVAAGVDFPARTVVVTAHSKRGHEGFNVLTASEFQQMSGRAGRRGKDTVGFCLIAPNPFCDARVLSDVAKSPPEPLRSAYFASPSTVLNLLKYRDVEDLKFTVKNSLGGFVDAQDAELMRVEARELETQILELDQESQDYKKKAKKVRRILRKADELEQLQNLNLDSSISALKELKYLEPEGALTEKGQWSAELCTSLVLELSEAIENFLFFELSLQQFAALVGSVAGDTHRNYLKIKQSSVPQDRFDKFQEYVENVAGTYQSTQITSEVAVLPDAAATVEAWIEAETWADFSALLRLANVADGDAARLITQTADHLQQISRLGDSHPDLAENAAKARELLLKPPISDVF